jgi:BCD family chlorophyll transporter-like MFS transporter
MAGAFALLAFASVSQQAHWLSQALTLLGFGSGLFTVGGVALMMDMTSTEQTGLFVGAWTLIQALAKGPASIAGGALQTGFVALGAGPAQAYAGVFAAEGLGVLLAVYLLSRVGVAAFRHEVASFGALAAEAMD